MSKNKKIIFILLFVLLNSQFAVSSNLSMVNKLKTKFQLSLFEKNYLLIKSIIENETEKAKYLLEKCGVDANAEYKQLASPLFYALAKKNFDIAKLLLNKGAKATIIDLHLAIMSKNIDIVRLILENNADLDLKSSWITALIAYENDNDYKEIIKLVKEYKNKKKEKSYGIKQFLGFR